MTIITPKQATIPTIIMVPSLEEKPWPSLGPALIRWMEKNLVFGPGDLRGEKLKLSPERKALLCRMYEVYPQGHPKEGRRRFRRVAISVRKGVGKTEFGAIIAAAELSLTAPVRCIGFNAKGQPIGGPVRDAYIPMVAVTEEQSDELAFGALRVIIDLSPIADQFDVGLERIMRKDGSGKAVALANAPDARDGARTTFSLADETHRWTRPALKAAHRTMLANLPKRRKADPWALEVTTAPAPGERSVAEDTMEYAQAIFDGRLGDAEGNFFFFHRQASDAHDLSTVEGRRDAVIEASGPDAEWSDIDGIVAQWDDPTQDKAYLRRVWLNQLVRASDKAFDIIVFKRRTRVGYVVKEGAQIGLGFDGAVSEDAASIVATELVTGFQWMPGLWEKPYKATDWRVPEERVDETVADMFNRFAVWRFYCDPWYWENQVANWTGRYNDERVVRWPTNKWAKMASAVRAFNNAMQDDPRVIAGRPGYNSVEVEGKIVLVPTTIQVTPDVTRLTHDGNEALTRHVSNAYRMYLKTRDERGEFEWVIQKERPDSALKIDAAMAAILSWEVRRDAVAAGIIHAEVETNFKVEWF